MSPMTHANKLTIIILPKGQVILPEAIRRRYAHAGTRLTVEETVDGVLLKPPGVFARTKPDEVFGLLAHKDPPKTLDEMEAGFEAEVRRRHARY
ncbi:hypothetical protein BN1110_05360 [bacterium YEK0313]|nr:hypothetical protein BN1110_05360 [bacterium YEK0313]